MKAGFSEIEYTPIQGFMPGQFSASLAKGSYTPLQANAAAFENEGTVVILISADHLFFPTDYATAIRKEIADATGVPMQNVLLAATHTHTGPALDREFWKTPGEPEIAQVVAHRIVKSGVEAFKNMQGGAALSVASAEESRFSFCRLARLEDGSIATNPGYDRADVVCPYDEPDHTIEILRVTRDKKTLAILVNFANHPDTNYATAGMTRERNKFCADWPGFMRLALKEAYGEDVVVLFFNGCCGDVNHFDFFHKSNLALHTAPGIITPECMGRGMAETITRALDAVTETERDETITVEEKTLTVNRRQLTDEELAWAKDTVERAKTEYLPIWEIETATACLRDGQNVPATEPFVLTGYRVGPWGMLAMPGEMFSLIGKELKRNSPFAHTVPVELANGLHGYVIPDEVRASGAYEGRFTSGTTGAGTADAVIAGGAELLKKIYG
ncbi:MAG: hypothetical protein IKC31_04490 [Clostridia bacterium]|nr:hypothetical protein [Clostridia bacterium]